MAELHHLNYNDPAPELDIQTMTGETIALSSLWQAKPLLLALTRHYGCPQCKEMLAELVEAKVALTKAGLAIAAVTQGNVDETAEFAKLQAPGILCLADPERKVYRAFGLDRGNAWQVMLAPQVIQGTARATKRGHKAGLPPKGQDVMQMSGTFIIGTDGRIRLPYYYETIADHPSVDLLLHGVLSTDWNKPFDAPLA